MGTEALWIPLVASAVGAGASYYNTSKTNDRRDSALATQLRNQQGTQRRADAEVQRLIADTAASNPKDETAEALGQYTDALRRNAGKNTSAIQTTGGVSSAFKDDAAAATAGIAEEGKTLSGIMSRIDGAIRQREGEANRRLDSQSILGLLSREMGGQTFLDNLRIQGIQENPWLTALSSATSGYAQNYSGGGMTGKSGSRLKPLRYKGNVR
jgi:hypothetical protein